MKELTIEEKAKAYDDLLVKLQKAKVDNNVCDEKYCCVIDDIVPELKESEDDRIKKIIKQSLKYYFEGKLSSGTNDVDYAVCLSWLEKQSEQKLTDNIEPKFKVNDWVINTITNEVEQVIELTDCEYICSEHLIVSFNNQHLLRRWTIQDAKDGDVLSFNDGHGNDCIELIKSITNKKIEFWFCLTNGERDEEFDGPITYTNLVSRKDATPATKEQRNLLFQKMRESGYEWDAEKKELKKIEQNSAWSEEDMKIIDSIIDYIKPMPLFFEKTEGESGIEYTRTFIDKATNWLEALKERVQLHNTWKPSDKQMEALKESYDEHWELDGIDPLYTLYQDLKKLREE